MSCQFLYIPIDPYISLYILIHPYTNDSIPAGGFGAFGSSWGSWSLLERTSISSDPSRRFGFSRASRLACQDSGRRPRLLRLPRHADQAAQTSRPGAKTASWAAQTGLPGKLKDSRDSNPLLGPNASNLGQCYFGHIQL